jgi:iron complex transport system substrate-binding protein
MQSIARKLKIFLYFLLTIILVSACSDREAEPLAHRISQVGTAQNSQPSSPSLPSIPMRRVRHAMGETQVPANPQRVITLDTGHLANALALGIQPIGSTAWYRNEYQTGLGSVEPYLRDRTQKLTILGYGFGANEVSLEKILLLKPDLIVAVSPHKAIYEQLSKIAPTVVYDYPKGDGWKDFLRASAEALGKTQEAEALLRNYHQRTQEFKQKMDASRVSVVAPKEQANRLRHHAPNIQVSVIHPLQEGTRIMYRDFFGGSILQDVGLSRPPEQDKDGTNSAPVSLELIPKMGGDVIFSISFRDEDSLKLVEKLQNHPLWSQLEAVKQSKVYPVNAEHWYGGDIVTANLVLDDLFKYLIDVPKMKNGE